MKHVELTSLFPGDLVQFEAYECQYVAVVEDTLDSSQGEPALRSSKWCSLIEGERGQTWSNPTLFLHPTNIILLSL